jgi:hypothetical protein
VSIRITNDHPWSDDEKAFVLARSGGKELVAINEGQFPSGGKSSDSGDDEKIELDEDVVKKVKALGEDETRAALKERGLDYEGDLSDAKLRLARHLSSRKG